MNQLSIPSLLRRSWRISAPLTVFGLASGGLAVFTALMSVIDPRLIAGAPAWIKPLKFAISTWFYAFTLIWSLGLVQGHRRWVQIVAWVTSLTLGVELVLIVTQVVRGVRSHFNVATPFDLAVFSTMGTLIVVAWVMTFAVLILITRTRLKDRSLSVALRWGLVSSLVGAGLAFLMTAPTPAQIAEMQTGQAPVLVGAHSVGVPDGGAGLPFLGWSTEGGDLRIPHFVGLHGLQILPFLWAGLIRMPRLGERKRTRLLFTWGWAYLGLIGLLAWQALRGQPLLNPDETTLLAAFLLAGSTILASFLILRSHETPTGGLAVQNGLRPADSENDS